MKEFFQVLRRFVPPYKKYLVLTVVFNILSAILNIFSFLAIMPILKILFKIDATDQHPVLLPLGSGDIKDVLTNNMNYYVYQMIDALGASTTLLVIGLFLAFMTFLRPAPTSSRRRRSSRYAPAWCATYATSSTAR